MICVYWHIAAEQIIAFWSQSPPFILLQIPGIELRLSSATSTFTHWAISLVYNSFLDICLFLFCVEVFCLHVCVCTMCMHRPQRPRGHQISWNWNYRCLWTTTQVLGIESKSSGRAYSAFNTELPLLLQALIVLGGTQPLALGCADLWGSCKEKEGFQTRGQESFRKWNEGRWSND